MAFIRDNYQIAVHIGTFTLYHYKAAKGETFADVTYGDGVFFMPVQELTKANDVIVVEAEDIDGDTGARLYRVVTSSKVGVTLRRLTHA